MCIRDRPLALPLRGVYRPPRTSPKRNRLRSNGVGGAFWGVSGAGRGSSPPTRPAERERKRPLKAASSCLKLH
eukprot:8284821-Alexandrium_andersonii.AAC.1